MKSIIISKDQASKYIFSLFFLLVLFISIYNHLFTAKKRTQIVPNALANPIEKTFIENLTEFKIKNPRLEVRLEKKGDSWILTEPKKFPLKSDIAQKIMSTLRLIKITKIYPNDSINRETFRLEKGLSSILLQSGEESLEIFFGLNNSVDRTSYIRLSGQNTIFQIESLNYDFATIELNDLINIRLFAFEPTELEEVMVNKGSQNKWHRVGIVKSAEGVWQNTYKKDLDQSKVQDYLKNLTSIRFSHLIDIVSDDLKEKLETIFKYPSFNVSFKHKGQIVTALISRPLKYDIESLDIAKDRFVMIQFDNTPILYLMPKRNLDFLEKSNTKDLR